MLFLREMNTNVLLEVKVGKLIILSKAEQTAERLVVQNDTLVLGLLELVSQNVLLDFIGDISARHECSLILSQKLLCKNSFQKHLRLKLFGVKKSQKIWGLGVLLTED